MPILDRSFFDTTNFFKSCASSQEPLQESLLLQLEEAWSSLIANDEAESLMSDVNHLIHDFASKGSYPSLDEVKSLLFGAHSDYWQQIVKWASVYAGLAAIAARQANISDARQLIASSALVLFHGYRPLSEAAHQNYASSKGGAARNAKWKELKEELHKLIEQEVSPDRERFNSKKEAAKYFAPLLNDAANGLGIENSKVSMEGTIRNWFSTDDALNALIVKLISETPTRTRSKR